MDIPVPVAIGTSLVAIVAPALAGVVTHYRLGNLDFGRAVPLVLAGIAGARGGAWGIVWVSERRLKQVLVALLLLGGSYMFMRGLGILGS